LGNTRADTEAAYGAPTGETPTNHLVVYRRQGNEYRMQYAPTDPQRSVLVARVASPGSPLQPSQAQAESRALAPLDAQPRGAQPEANLDFVVERFTSPTLARALPSQLFQQARGQPGDYVVVYLRDPQGVITRFGLGIGDDVDAVRNLISE